MAELVLDIRDVYWCRDCGAIMYREEWDKGHLGVIIYPTGDEGVKQCAGSQYEVVEEQPMLDGKRLGDPWIAKKILGPSSG